MLLSRIFPINFVVYQNHLSCLVVPLSSFEFLEEEKNRLAFDPFYSSELNPRTPRFDIFSLTINGWVTTFFFFVRFHRLKWGICNLICTVDLIATLCNLHARLFLNFLYTLFQKSFVFVFVYVWFWNLSARFLFKKLYHWSHWFEIWRKLAFIEMIWRLLSLLDSGAIPWELINNFSVLVNINNPIKVQS